MRQTPSKYAALAATLVAFLLFGLAASAQPGPKRGGGPKDGERLLERMTRLLDLSEGQVTEIDAILEAHRGIAEDHREARRANREAMEAALDVASPDPTTVGELFLSGRELARKAAADRELVDEQIAGVLTDEQEAKWEGFRKGRHGGRGGFGRGHRGPSSSSSAPGGGSR